MTRRVSLPGADELFRSTAPAAAPAAPDPAPAREREPDAPATEPGASVATVTAMPGAAPQPAPAPEWDAPPDTAQDELDAPPPRRRPRPLADRRPTGRERHEEKITVYCSAEELIDIERARLTLRGEYGLAADRGRIVREALAVVLADLEAKGEQSVLVRRLRGR
jgi:hypothetical protein